MVKRDKKARLTKRVIEISSEEERDSAAREYDDDAEANEDLSVKILEQALLRPENYTDAISDGVVMITDLRNVGDANNISEVKKKRKNNNKKKNEELDGSESSHLDTNFKSFCGELFTGDIEKEERQTESEKVAEVVDKVAEINPVETSNDLVLRRLLRGPRYFDPPDNSWGTCYNCGEEGHASVNCTAARRKKPCFICGSLEHNAKQCAKEQDCFICKKGGHRAKDCPDKNRKGSQNSKICLKCGDAGHDLFSCRSSYCPDDLKEIQCYVCRNFGHLCCEEYTDSGSMEVSCYRCGQLGHTGLSCIGSRGETVGAGSLRSCYRCGEEGHFARECTSSTKVGQRIYESSTPKKRLAKESRDFEVRSVPNDFGKAHKKKKILPDGGFKSASKSRHRGGWSTEHPGDFQEYNAASASASKSKYRGGWIADDPGDFRSSRYQASGWRSPATPRNEKAKHFNSSSHPTTSLSSERFGKLSYYSAGSYGSGKYYQQRFSASRFDNNSSDMMRRNYDW